MYHTILPIYNGWFTVSFKTVPSFEKIHCFTFLVVDQNGDAVLVDAGFSPGNIPGPYTGFTQDPEHRLEDSLASMGFSPASISNIILTHLHWDHTAGMRLFPHARFYIQAEEFWHLFRLNPNEETYYWPKDWISLLHQVEPVAGNLELKPGLQLIYSGHHTGGHQVVEVQTRSGPVILGGDVTFNFDWLWKSVPPASWQAYREGIGARFYWEEEIWATLKNWLAINNIHSYPLRPLQIKEIKSRGRLINAHDPRLLEIKTI